MEFVQKQLRNPVEELKQYSDVPREVRQSTRLHDTVYLCSTPIQGADKKSAVGFFRTNTSNEYHVYEKVKEGGDGGGGEVCGHVCVVTGCTDVEG